MKKPILLFALALVALTIACSKLQESPNPAGSTEPLPSLNIEPTAFNNLAAVLASTQTKSETLQGDPSQQLSLSTQSGAKILIYPNSLVDMGGNVVSGSVDFKITEYISPESMIRSNVQTLTSTGELLHSGGMFKLEVNQNGNPLRIGDGFRYGVEFPNKDNNMEPFIGTVGSDGSVKWVRRNDWFILTDSGTFFNTMYLDSFTFTNLDQFVNMPNKTDVQIKLDPSQVDMEVMINVIFKSIRTVVKIPKSSTPGLFETGTHYDVPSGENVQIVVFGFDKDGYLYWKDFNHTFGDNESIQLKKIDKIAEVEFNARLASLK